VKLKPPVGGSRSLNEWVISCIQNHTLLYYTINIGQDSEVCILDTLLSHEVMGENLWMAVKWRNWCWKVTMHPDCIHTTTHIHTI